MDRSCIVRLIVPLEKGAREENGDRKRPVIGTGYAITPRLVLTARHVLEPHDEGRPIFDRGAPIRLEFVNRRSSTEAAATPVFVSRTSLVEPEDGGLDLMLLKLPEPIASVPLTHISPTRPEALRTDTRWQSEGFPVLAEKFSGSHENYPFVGKLYQGVKDCEWIELEVDSGADSWRGLSGAPVFDVKEGVLVGVITDQVLAKVGWLSGRFFSSTGGLDGEQLAGHFQAEQLTRILDGKRLVAVSMRQFLDDPSLSRAYLADVEEDVDLSSLRKQASQLLDLLQNEPGFSALTSSLGLSDDKTDRVDRLCAADPNDVVEALAVARARGMDARKVQQCCWAWLALNTSWSDVAKQVRSGGGQQAVELKKLSLVEMAVAHASARPAAYRWLKIEGKRVLFGLRGLPVARLEGGIDSKGAQAAGDLLQALSLSMGYSESLEIERLRVLLPAFVAGHISEGATVKEARADLKIYHKAPDPQWIPPYAVLTVFEEDDRAHVDLIASTIYEAFGDLLPVLVIDLRSEPDERSIELDRWLVRIFQSTRPSDDASTPPGS